MENVINSAIVSAMKYAKFAHEEVLKDTPNENLAASYIAAALAKCSKAEVIYYTKYYDSNQQLEDFFAQFDTFSNEVLTNIHINHSHQWSALEYETLCKLSDALDK